METRVRTIPSNAKALSVVLTDMRILIALLVTASVALADQQQFVGKHFSGAGDIEYVELLDISRRMFEPDPQYQNMSMLYEPKWNGLLEGPTWECWWIQNSYGTTYASLPFLHGPLVTFL